MAQLEDPDEIDCAVHAEAEKVNDGTTAALEEFQPSVND